MIAKWSLLGALRRAAAVGLALAALGGASAASAQADHGQAPGQPSIAPGNLLVSASEYSPADIEPGVTQLPPGCTDNNCKPAVAGGAFPYVFDNDSADGSFGVPSRVSLDELTPSGRPIGRIDVAADQLVTSFSSKSELALNLSPDRHFVSFVGYVAKPATLDVSNANTPGVIDPTNPVPGAYYRVVAQLNRLGRFTFTETNA